ncbi:MAG: 2-dehydropantoate 2-reductase [Candidatus Hodarchaeales archaeon]|jgi:2-dehydropantoate 2-reductase
MWKDKKIVIFGVGGVGGYFGGLLAEKGLDVTFIARGESANVMKSKGLRVESVNGDFVINPVQVTDNPSEIGPVSLVMVCVKAPQVNEVAQLIKPLVDDNTIILPLQNGIDAPSQLIEVYGKKNVIGGICKILSTKVGPGHIRHSGVSIIDFGEMDEPASSRVEDLKDMLTYAGIDAVVHNDFRKAQWAKMILVSALSGVTAVTRSTAGTIRSIPETREMLVRAMRETFLVAQGLGVNLPESIVDNILKNAVDYVPEDTTTSMQRDIMEGKPSELHFQVGSVVRIGEEIGVEVPVNRFLYHSLLPMELRARGK